MLVLQIGFFVGLQLGGADFLHLELQHIHAPRPLAGVVDELLQFFACGAQFGHLVGHAPAHVPQVAIAIQQVHVFLHTEE